MRIQQTAFRDLAEPRRSLRNALLSLSLLALLGAEPAAAIFVPCGDADGSGVVTTVDALAALRSSVDLPSPCDRNCDCDTDADREMSAGDALEILAGAVGEPLGGCGFYDGCFYDEDCDAGHECGTDPDWSCDAACVPI
jgi:hypothetical protein